MPALVIATLALPALPVAASMPTKAENAAFSAAVKAVKDRNYAQAIKLFEAQAKQARHDAQYNLAVLLNAGKGRPRNYVEALYWAWQAQLGDIEAAADIVGDITAILPPKAVDDIRTRVGDTLQARIDKQDLLAIPQFARFHLTVLDEPDYTNAYIWYSIAAALNMPETIDARDEAEGKIEDKDLVKAQMKTQELFDKYEFKPMSSPKESEQDSGQKPAGQKPAGNNEQISKTEQSVKGGKSGSY